MSKRKDQCGFCGSDKQKVCWQCCCSNMQEIRDTIKLVKEDLEKQIQQLADLVAAQT